ncbi:hypothetical protein NKI96_10710 [Mesorhizobium sp. M0292]|uniref:hypothetical protein n=1 Tax=Mesorhizobium sp. M0292 TaxID=2956929 RepID=UPI00333C6A95
MRKLLIAALLTCIPMAATAKETAYLIDGDMGGELLRYYAKAEIMRGSKVIVDGVCLSACAMYLRQDWKLDICYTPSATFGFHKPYQVLDNGTILTGIGAITTADAGWRTEFFDKMPLAIKAMLTGKQIPEPSAGDPTDRFVFIKARDLSGAVKPCAKDWAAKYRLIDVRDVYITDGK